MQALDFIIMSFTVDSKCINKMQFVDMSTSPIYKVLIHGFDHFNPETSYFYSLLFESIYQAMLYLDLIIAISTQNFLPKKSGE